MVKSDLPELESVLRNAAPIESVEAVRFLPFTGDITQRISPLGVTLNWRSPVKLSLVRRL